jgi:hypothetical protein
MITFHDNYLYGIELDNLDNKQLAKVCIDIRRFYKKTQPPEFFNLMQEEFYDVKNYNIFMCPDQAMIELYYTIGYQIKPYLEDRHYMIRGWANVFSIGQGLDWHRHWHSPMTSWHGFYCVDVGESATYYKIPMETTIKTVTSKDGLLVFGKNGGDEHKTSVWRNFNKPRITIGFDIIPMENLTNTIGANYYVPIAKFL